MNTQYPTNSSETDAIASGIQYKKAYQTPMLVEFGSVAKLTSSGGRTVNDGGTTKRMFRTGGPSTMTFTFFDSPGNNNAPAKMR